MKGKNNRFKRSSLYRAPKQEPTFGSREAVSGETEIYLLMNQKEPRAAGFYDPGARKAFTLAFTTQEKAKEFLDAAQPLGILKDRDMLFRMTCDEYFEWVEKGKAAGELVIDADPVMLPALVDKVRLQDN